jgi:hypothetical protein
MSSRRSGRSANRYPASAPVMWFSGKEHQTLLSSEHLGPKISPPPAHAQPFITAPAPSPVAGCAATHNDLQACSSYGSGAWQFPLLYFADPRVDDPTHTRRGLRHRELPAVLQARSPVLLQIGWLRRNPSLLLLL